MGFSYNAVEYGGHRGVTSLDLNRDHVPYRLRSSFDLVVNAGTTEHVVNQDNAFRVMHDLTKVGGVMMHEVPAGGMLTHGVVSYNPQFFWLLCRDNNYEVIDLTVSHAGRRADQQRRGGEQREIRALAQPDPIPPHRADFSCHRDFAKKQPEGFCDAARCSRRSAAAVNESATAAPPAIALPSISWS